MPNIKEKMKKLNDQAIAGMLHKKLISETNKNILKFFKEVVNRPEVKQNPVVGKGTTDAVNDLLLTNCLLTAMTEHGRPAELLFITESGETIDLLKEKLLNQEEFTNIFLDHFKNQEHEKAE